MIARPKGGGWRTMPSVQPGGKEYFWHRRTATMLQWVLWSRAAGGYICRIEFLNRKENA